MYDGEETTQLLSSPPISSQNTGAHLDSRTGELKAYKQLR
jgi:hypothetical protein